MNNYHEIPLRYITKVSNAAILLPTLILILSALLSTTVQAIEVAPRITDREIIESLAELKAGQKAMDKRFTSLENTMLTMFSALIMLIVALFGYIAWDRRTALKPLERKV